MSTRQQNNSDSEAAQLCEACQEYGFFLIDLKGPAVGDRLQQDAERTFDTSVETLHVEVLDKYILA